jgi:uncharacterized protein
MSSGFFALLDDIAAIAKAAAATIDDAAAQAVAVGQKSAGIVIDDAAVTPRYVVGYAAKRELPIIAKIAWGSIKNKLLYLLPGALLLSEFAPWAITPLLMLGAAYLCFEGYEKLHELMHPASSHTDAAASATVPPPSDVSEDAKIAGAIRTDFILSAEIMAISLAAVTAPDFTTRAMVLAIVGLLVTAAVYGAVALIVKADDFGAWLVQRGKTEFTRRIGRAIVSGMPPFLKLLSFIGMLAMLWVGGGIILHGLEVFDLGTIPHAIHDFAVSVGSLAGPLSGALTWLTDAAIAGVVGTAIGWLIALAIGAGKPAAH